MSVTRMLRVCACAVALLALVGAAAAQFGDEQVAPVMVKQLDAASAQHLLADEQVEPVVLRRSPHTLLEAEAEVDAAAEAERMPSKAELVAAAKKAAKSIGTAAKKVAKKAAKDVKKAAKKAAVSGVKALATKAAEALAKFGAADPQTAAAQAAAKAAADKLAKDAADAKAKKAVKAAAKKPAKKAGKKAGKKSKSAKKAAKKKSAKKAAAKKSPKKAGKKKSDKKAESKKSKSKSKSSKKGSKKKSKKGSKKDAAKSKKQRTHRPHAAARQHHRGSRGHRAGSRRSAAGWGISPHQPPRVQQRLPEARLTGAAATLTRANVRCVLCQFIVQKVKNELTAGSDESAASASLLEAFAFANAEEQSRITSLVEVAATADAKAAALPQLFESGPDASRRFRHTDVLASRAGRARFTQVRAGTGADAAEQRTAYLQLYSSVYASFEGLCAKRMPLAYLPYCNDMLKSYRFFAQGINYGDRAEQICMNGNFCDHRSYVRTVTHNAYQREPGDA